MGFIKRILTPSPETIENLTVRWVFLLLVFIGAFLLASFLMSICGYGDFSKRFYLPIIKFIIFLHQNWIALLILVVLMFYTPIRKLIERIRKLPGGVELEAPQEMQAIEKGPPIIEEMGEEKPPQIVGK